MSSNQPDCLTSLVSYVPELNFGFSLPSVATVNQLGISTTNQARQSIPLSPELLTSLEVVSARANNNCKCIAESQVSPQPLRPALKKASFTKSKNKIDEEFENNKKSCEKKRILAPKDSTGTLEKAEKPQPLPARLSQKKKTVAFGRTVNVSQTIEGTSHANRKFLVDSNSQKKIFPKMASDNQNLLDEFEKLKKEVHEMQLKIDELTMRDSERSGQFLKLTETVKKILNSLSSKNNEKILSSLSSKNNDYSKRREKKDETNICYCDKENIPPEEICGGGRITEVDERNPATHGEFFAESRKKIIGTPSKEELKWTIMKRKYAECQEFKHLVDEAIMKYGGDESLDILTSHQNEGDISRITTRRHEKKLQSVSPVIRSTTRVMKQMTVKQIQHCENSPASCAFSYDSKKYLARHGIIPALSDDDEMEHNRACDKRLNASVKSYYYPGNSVTYCSKNIKCGEMLLKDKSYNDYREERCQHKKERTPRVFDEANYQMDQFDTDDDEDEDDIIEISGEIENHCETGGKMRSSHDKRAWRACNDRQY